MPAMRAKLAVQGCEVSISQPFAVPDYLTMRICNPSCPLVQIQAELTFTQTFAYLCLQAVSELPGRA